MAINVIKRDGRKEPLDIEKLHKVVFWATENLSGVSASELELRSQIQFYNNIKTAEIQETMIQGCC
jgi:ribonucleoside-diphosphate reductase alpha chain